MEVGKGSDDRTTALDQEVKMGAWGLLGEGVSTNWTVDLTASSSGIYASFKDEDESYKFDILVRYITLLGCVYLWCICHSNIGGTIAFSTTEITCTEPSTGSASTDCGTVPSGCSADRTQVFNGPSS